LYIEKQGSFCEYIIQNFGKIQAACTCEIALCENVEEYEIRE